MADAVKFRVPETSGEVLALPGKRGMSPKFKELSVPITSFVTFRHLTRCGVDTGLRVGLAFLPRAPEAEAASSASELASVMPRELEDGAACP